MQISEHANINIYRLAVYFRSQDYVDKNYYNYISNDKDIGKQIRRDINSKIQERK